MSQDPFCQHYGWQAGDGPPVSQSFRSPKTDSIQQGSSFAHRAQMQIEQDLWMQPQSHARSVHAVKHSSNMARDVPREDLNHASRQEVMLLSVVQIQAMIAEALASQAAQYEQEIQSFQSQTLPKVKQFVSDSYQHASQPRQYEHYAQRTQIYMAPSQATFQNHNQYTAVRPGHRYGPVSLQNDCFIVLGNVGDNPNAKSHECDRVDATISCRIVEGDITAEGYRDIQINPPKTSQTHRKSTQQERAYINFHIDGQRHHHFFT